MFNIQAKSRPNTLKNTVNIFMKGIIFQHYGENDG